MPRMRTGLRTEGAGARNGKKTRQNIVNGAMLLFARKGLDGTSIRDIADEAGESLSTIYYYFKDKDDLYYSVLSESMLEAMQPVAEAELDTSGDTTKRLGRLLAAYQEAVRKHPATAMLVTHGSLNILDRPEPFLATIFSDRQRAIENIVREGAEKGEVVDVDPALFSAMFLGSILIFNYQNHAAESVEGWPNPAFASEDLDDFMEGFLLQGLRRPAIDAERSGIPMRDTPQL